MTDYISSNDTNATTTAAATATTISNSNVVSGSSPFRDRPQHVLFEYRVKRLNSSSAATIGKSLTETTVASLLETAAKADDNFSLR